MVSPEFPEFSQKCCAEGEQQKRRRLGDYGSTKIANRDTIGRIIIVCFNLKLEHV